LIKSEHDIRVVILTARGKHFTAGLDLKDAGNLMVDIYIYQSLD